MQKLIKSLRLSLVLSVVVFSGLARAEMNEDLARFESKPDSVLHGMHSGVVDDYHYVFVGGYLNETVRSHYFELNVQTIKDMGGTTVHRIFPSSFRSASANRGIIRDRVLHLFKIGNGRPIVLIGHSKGGLEVLATVLAHPELVEQGIISDAIVFQAPVGGNVLHDSQGAIKKTLVNTMMFTTAYHSLRTPSINKIIGRKIEALPAATRQRLSKVVKYVISSKKPDEMGIALRALSMFAAMESDYDGLVARDAMWIPGFGTILGDLRDTDHMEMVTGKYTPVVDNFSPNKVRAFTMSLLANILKSHNPRNQEYKLLTEQRRRELLSLDVSGDEVVESVVAPTAIGGLSCNSVLRLAN